MKPPRFSLSHLLVVVAVVAVNLTLLRRVFFGPNNEVILEAAGVILMANILALGLYRILRCRGRGCPFTLGFVAGGLVAVIAHLACVRVFQERLSDAFIEIYLPIAFFLQERLMPPSSFGTPDRGSRMPRQ